MDFCYTFAAMVDRRLTPRDPMSASPSPPPPTPVPQGSHEFADRLLAESIRCLEESQGAMLDEPDAERQAREAGGSFEQRLLHRARHLRVSADLQRALGQLRWASLIILVLAGTLAFAAGLTAGSTALGSDEDANVYWILGSLLSLPILTLLLWLVLWWLRPSALHSLTLGSAVLALARRLDRWLHQGQAAWAATRASVAVFGGGALGRWLLSAITHGLWALFLGGCLLMLVAVLAFRQYSFYWETTILSEQSYVPLTRGLAWLPERLGFSTPGVEQIRASRWEGAGQAPRLAPGAWSGFLLGSLVVYGLLPRLLLLALSLFMIHRESRRYRLDPGLPGFERLRPRLLPVATSLGVVDPDPGPNPLPPTPAPQSDVGTGPPALLGLEIAPPSCGWPPPAQDIAWWDLGIINTREDFRRVLTALSAASEPPRLLVVICSLATTPDRGIRNQLLRLGRETTVPLALVLTEGQRLRVRERHAEMDQRIHHWRALGSEVGIDDTRVVTVDLDHLTPASQAVLARLIGTESSRAVASALDEAFALIVTHARRWSVNPGSAEQAELQQQILQCYRARQRHWPGFLQLSGDPRRLGAELQDGARQMAALLPGRLRQDPRWLATGAMTGALGCIAAATLLTPVAISGLPLWAGLGAAVAFAMNPGQKSTGAVEAPDLDLGEAVASATLFATLLELQSLEEQAITEFLDRLLPGEPPRLEDAGAVAHWLDALRQRFDALRLEYRP